MAERHHLITESMRDGAPPESSRHGGEDHPVERHPLITESGRDGAPLESSRHGGDDHPVGRHPLITESMRDGAPPESSRHGGDDHPVGRHPLITESGRDGAPLESSRHGEDDHPVGRHRSVRPAVERHPLITESGRDYAPLESSRHVGNDQPLGRHPLIIKSRKDGASPDRASHGGDDCPVGRHRSDRPAVERRNRGRRDNAAGYHRDESARAGYDRAWHALSGYGRSMSPMCEGSPHTISSYERMSVERAHTMKDFEKQITELKKENFNLKLRIYFLEEQMQRRCDTSSDELHRMNIELKVEVESLKHDFQEKHNLLIRASKAMEGLAGEHELAFQQLREEHLKHLQDMEDSHSHKIHLLDAHEKAELEKMCLLLDKERMQSFNAEERLLALNEQYTKSMGILEERDWIIQCLNETVHSKDALIAQLEKQIASMMPYEASSGKNIGNLYLESDATDLLQPPKPICYVDVADGKDNANEWQKKIKEMDSLINELQQKLEAGKARAAAEEKNSLKRDKAIQGLTQVLKKKTKEMDKLSDEIENLNAALSKAREAAQQAQLHNIKENIHPDYKKLIFTLQAEQDLYSRLLKYERGSGSLQKELESIAMLRKWLEENIQANQELRKIMEAQIMAKYKDDSMSFLGDQTSYLSICLDHLDQNEYFFAGGPHGTAVFKSGTHFGEFNLGEDAGTQTQNHVPASAAGSPKLVQGYESDLSFNQSNTVMGEDGENDAKSTRNKLKSVSTATQTEASAFSDLFIPVNVSRSLKESAELMCLQDGELNIPSQRFPQKTSNTTCKIRGRKQGEVFNFSQNAKKSRLPVLLKSSLNTKLKTDAALTHTKENYHSYPEESQIQNSRLYEQLRCAEMEVQSLKENRDLLCENRVPDGNNLGHEQRDPTEQDVHNELENHRLSKELRQAESEITTLKAKELIFRRKESEFYLDSGSKQNISREQALRRELQEESHRDSEQLKQVQMEFETLKASEEMIKHKDVVPDLSGFIKRQRESSDQELQAAENYRLSEQLKRAQIEIEMFKASEDLVKHKEMDSTDQALQKELQAENRRLSEQLKRAQMEIETLKAYEEFVKHKETLLDLSRCNVVQIESTDQALQKDVKTENHRLSEQLEQAQKTLKANEELLACKTCEYDLCNSEEEQKKAAERALQKELRAENCILFEQLKQAEIEIETLKASEELLRRKISEYDLHNSLQNELRTENYRLSEQLNQAQIKIETVKGNEELIKHKYPTPGLSSSFNVQRASEDPALQNNLQAENYRLSEELKTARIEIETLTLKENAALINHTDIISELSSANKLESTDQVLQKELHAENYRLSEQLKQAKMEVEKLQAERSSVDSTDDSLKLHCSDADDDLSEQSCLDKTITNPVNVNEVDVTSDFGDELFRPSVNSRNAVALRCHHYSHCTECANNRGIISLPTSNSKRASTVCTSSKFTKVSCSVRSFEDTTSLSKYDLLVQSQARELSLQRQKIKESHNLTVVCSKNFCNILKAFENLLPANALDSNISEGFQEQITQTVEWLKELEYKLSDALYGEEDAYSDHSVDSLLYTPSRLVPGHRMWADKHGCHVLGLVEDYNALRKQILEARNVLQETEAFIDHGVQTAVLKMTEHFGNIFFEKLTRTKQSLDEAGCLLKLLWRVSLPLPMPNPYNINQEEEGNLEITRLRKRVFEQEKLLSGMVKRVYSENQMKEDIEKLILHQLAMTHDILKKAKGNLEVQVVDKLP